MRSFEHFTPHSLPEALEVLSQQQGDYQLIAGGTDLMLKIKKGILRPKTVVNLKQVPELKGISFEPETGLWLGALTTLRELTRAALIQEHYPSLAYAASLMASEQIRSFATVGGNLCNAAPSADLAPPLMALDGTATLVSKGGERTLPLEEFFLGPGQTALQPGEILQEIRLPPPSGESVYLKHASRAFMDIAVVGVAVSLQREDETPRAARIVLGAVAPVPKRARRAEAVLTGAPLTEETIHQAAKTAAEESSPIDDVRSTAWYRRRMVEVFTRRAIQIIQQD